MLDLTTINKFYELKWFDGTVLSFDKPKEAFLREMVKLEKIKDTEEQIEKTKEITYKLLVTNLEGKKFTKAEKDILDMFTCLEILKDYMKEVELRLGES